MEISKNRILWYIPEEEWEDFAKGLASYHSFADPEIDPDALYEYILFILAENSGELTIQELWVLADLAVSTRFDPLLHTIH